MGCSSYSFSTTISEINCIATVGGELNLATTVCETRPRMTPFLFEAGTDGTESPAGTWTFELDTTPISNSVQVNISGNPQSILSGDYSVSGAYVIVPDIETGDKVYGFYEY